MDSTRLCRIAVLVLAFVMTPSLCLCSTSNFDLLDSLSKNCAQSVAEQVPAQSNIKLSVSDHAARWIVYQHLLRALNERHVTVSDTASTLLDVGIVDCAVRYALCNDRDSLRRTLNVELRATLGKQELSSVHRSLQDVFARSELNLIEVPRYEFSSSIAPTQPRSMWDDILNPLIVLGAMATTVILLFSVRSQ